jgi:hypothetical protein
MNNTQYLKAVSDTIAAIGNRGNNGFIEAFMIANQAITTGFSEPVMAVEAKRCRDALVKGLETYTQRSPESPWWDAKSAVEMASLVAKFNSTSTAVGQFQSDWDRLV